MDTSIDWFEIDGYMGGFRVLFSTVKMDTCFACSRKYGDFCNYHVQSAYKKTSATRSELQGRWNVAAILDFLILISYIYIYVCIMIYFITLYLEVLLPAYIASWRNLVCLQGCVCDFSVTGLTPKSFQDKLLPKKGSHFFYGGQTFTSLPWVA